MNVVFVRKVAWMLLFSSLASCELVTGTPNVITSDKCTENPVIVSWQKLADSSDFRPRDSAGEYWFNNKIWIMGGWEDSFSPNPRDVWSFTRDSGWKLEAAAAPWTHGDLSGAIVHANRMWLLGGWANGRLANASASNEVWSSSDGTNWTRHPTPGWEPRLGLSAASKDGKIWITGGTTSYYHGTPQSLRNDVWMSNDGGAWINVAIEAPWSRRAYHTAIVHEGNLVLMGGGNYTPTYFALNDVWSTEDGYRWKLLTSNAEWSPRIWFSAVSYRGYIWLIGGWSSDPYHNYNDVWYSRTGKSWALYKSNSEWSPRHEHSVVVSKDSLILIAGFDGRVRSDVWSLYLPDDWVGSCDAN